MPQDRNELHSPTTESIDEHCDGENEDEIPDDFPEIDHFKLYALGVCFVLSMPLLLSAGYTLSYVFTAGTVSYRCLIPDCEDLANTTLHPFWLPNAVPHDNDEFATCTRFTVQNSTDSCSTTVFTEVVESCDTWVYDPEELTILNEWDLTCDNNMWKLALPGTINNAGVFVGMIFSGYLSDKYGRRNVLTIATLTCTIFGLVRSFSINYIMFLVFEFFDAVGGAAVYSAGFVLAMEFVGPTKRVLAANVTCCTYVLGEVLFGLCAMWFRSWRYTLVTFYVPGLLVVFLPCLVPDSIRWLLSRGRVSEAEAVLRKVAAKNGIEVSQKSIEILEKIKKKSLEKQSREELKSNSGISVARQVIDNRTILIRLIVCAVCWAVTTFVYYGLSLSSVNLSGNKYTNFILVALVECPGQLITWVLVEYMGRKRTLSGSFLLSGVLCIVTIFIPEDWWYLVLTVFLGGKLCITVAFSVIYIHTAEMFPTPIRHSLLGFCSMIARIGSMIAPQIPQLSIYMTSLPLLLFGTSAAVGSILSLHFPETLGIKLPDTLQEAMDIGKVKKEVKYVPQIV